jgi:arylsulfatase
VPERPNILLIYADQHRFDCLGAAGNSNLQTPSIDDLAADGVRYSHAFCPFPVCTPSRYSLLSGLYVHQHLGWNNRCTLPHGIDTFPRLLRDSGYRTAAVGKMHFTPTYLDVGFDRMVLAEQDGPGRYDDDYHRWLRDEGLYDRVDLMDQVRAYRAQAPAVYWDTYGALPSDLDEAHHSTTWIAEGALDELAAWDAAPNLLMVGFIKPHHPFDPPRPWDVMYDPEALSVLPGWTAELSAPDRGYRRGYFDNEALTELQLRRAMALYYAAISQIDHHVGRMVALLKKRGLYDRTLIVYTGDHGEYLGFHHLLLKGNHMYDPLVRVPLIVKYPGSDRAGEVCQALVSSIDLAPTLLACAGTAIPSSMEGLDLALPAQTRDLILAEGPRADQYMVRSARHKLLLCRDRAQSQFFDLEQDPLELHNRIVDPAYGDVVAAFEAALAQWALFDSPTTVHLDMAAPTINGPNVPQRSDGHAEEAIRYFQHKMAEPYELQL